jgi:large subunit ribosomal protein L19
MTSGVLAQTIKTTLKKEIKAPRPGEIVKVHQIVKEKDKERIQIFEGLVISVKKSKSLESTFTVRKVVEGSGVERIYPLYSPHIKRIEVVSSINARRAKLYYVRETNKKLKIKKIVDASPAQVKSTASKKITSNKEVKPKKTNKTKATKKVKKETVKN